MSLPDGWGRWQHYDNCVICPRCNAYVFCEDNDLDSILAAIPGHDCRADPGSGHYLRPPDVGAEGWYWAEPDGSYVKITGQGGRPG